MQKIHQLSPDVIAKIAAGEVIERPAYAVKELIENAIDANARSISIEIEEGGLKKIMVTDDGEGMSKKDIQECFKPHTTSKISTHDDLYKIPTLGFRGEALSSIAVICDMTIKSKSQKEVAGMVIDLRAGRVENISPIGIPYGTSILVENLFYPVPARKKFLKTQKTEFRQIVDIVTHIALAHPKIRFSLSHNKKNLFNLSSNLEGLDRIKILLGETIFSHLLPVSYEDSYIKIHGFIARPSLVSQNQQKQFLFINKRKVSDRLISMAVKEAYGNLVEAANNPVFILFLSLPYEAVDVNVHPRKEQVAFTNQHLIFEAARQAISQTLNKYNLTFHTNFSHKGTTKSFAGHTLKNTITPWSVKNIGKIKKDADIVQIHNTYLVTQTQTGILIVDQHAAHERILFEQFLEAFNQEKNKQKRFKLAKNVLMNFSYSETELLLEHIAVFEQLGFVIEHFKGNTFKLSSIPALIKDRDYVLYIKEVLDDILDQERPKSVDIFSMRMIEYLACRAAVKAGDVLNKKEARNLLEKLEKTINNYTCPHGRPTKYEVSLHEFHRYFKRA